MKTELITDEQLVEWSLTGDREAFGRIVERYQSLVCSITYGGTGSLSLSEDLAQETFVSAWRNLNGLRDATKLRAWLCGIARNLTNNFLRRGQHEPMRGAEPLDQIGEWPATEPSPSAQAVSREEEAILWRALAQIPESYREPMILFYREQRSIERVAADLELSEDAVKQRLSRGRKLLADEVAAFVEGALARTTPGKAFTLGVLAVLPSAPLATAGAVAAGKGAAAKSGLLVASLAVLAPFIGVCAAVATKWMVIRATMSGRERRARTMELIALYACVLGVGVGGEFAVKWMSQHFEWSDRGYFFARTGFWWLYAVGFGGWFVVFFSRMMANRQLLQEASQKLEIKPSLRVYSTIGGHLAMFLWLISVAWRAGDRLTAGVVATLMIGLSILNYFGLRGLSGLAAARANGRHFGMCCGLILVVLNLRLDTWMAAGYEVSVNKIHQMFPMWIVPVLSLALVLWVAFLLAITKPKHSA